MRDCKAAARQSLTGCWLARSRPVAALEKRLEDERRKNEEVRARGLMRFSARKPRHVTQYRRA